MTNELTVSEIMKVPSSTTWKIDQINMKLASKDAAMAVIEAEAAAMSDALRQIAESMGLGVGHTAAEIVAALKQRLTESGRDLQALKANPALGEWVEWKGGECPIAGGTRCETRLRDGSEDVRLAEEWVWMHNESEWDIIAYRTIP